MLVYKSPSEQFGVSLDFSADLGTGNSIASIVSATAANRVTGVDATALVIGSPAPAIDSNGTSVDLTLMGGLAGANYTISITVTSSIGETYVGEIILEIEGGGYTTIDAVAGMFGTFVRNSPKGPSDGQIQSYIDDVQAQVDAILQRRFQEAIGEPPALGSFTAWVDIFTQDQQNLLDKINRFGACAEMGIIFAATGQKLFADLAAQYEVKYQAELRKLSGQDEKENYDFLFDSQARVPTPRPTLDGVGGAENGRSSPAAFGKKVF